MRALFHRLPSLWKYSIATLLLSRVSDLANMYISVFLVIDHLPKDDLGALLPLQSLAGFVAVPMAVLLSVGAKFTHVFETRGEHGKTRRFLRDIAGITLLLSLLMAWLVAQRYPAIALRLRLEDKRLLWAMILMAASQAWVPLAQSISNGLQQWRSFILFANVLLPMARVLSMALLLPALALTGYFAASTLANLIVLAAFGWVILRHFRGKGATGTSYRADLRDILRFAGPIAVMIACVRLQEAVEPWVVRQRLSAHESGAFYFLLTFGRIPRFLAGATLPFIFMFAADRHERGLSTTKLHLQTLGFGLAAGLAFSLLLHLAAPWLAELRPSWAQYRAETPWLGFMALLQTLQLAMLTHMAHENGSRRFGYLLYFAPLLVAECLLLYGLNGWHFLRGHLSPDLWNWVYANVVTSLSGTLWVMMGTRVLLTLGILTELWRRYSRTKPSVPSPATCPDTPDAPAPGGAPPSVPA